jgi:signal transduction histidine kinase
MCKHDIRVLIVDDDPIDIEESTKALSQSFRHRFRIETSGTLRETLQRIRNESFDILLLDLGLPESSGLETLENVRAVSKEIPLVVLSGVDDEDTALAALDCGAQDYFLKGTVTADALVRSIRYSIHRHQVCSENEILVQELQANELVLKKNEEMLRSKNRRLEALCDTAHKFVDNVSHEFRTPLTVIKEYASLMIDGIGGPIQDEQKRMLDIIGDRTNDLANMVDDMLDISKMESGLLGITRKKCNILDILQQVRPGLEKKASIKNVRLEISEPDGLPELFCDAEKIGRVITNLSINAIKFSGDPGAVHVGCKLYGSSDVLVEVTDNGPGIDDRSLQEIFERFVQLQQDIRSSTKGFGLGLSICRELVDLNFGQMHVQSELGRGSCFSFNIPLYEPTNIFRRYLKRLSQIPENSGHVSLVSVTIDPHTDIVDANDVDTFISYLLRRNDLVFRSGDCNWLIALNTNDIELSDFSLRAKNTIADANRNRFKGPFPEIDWHSLGTWHAISELDVLCAKASDAMQTTELIHV